MTREPSKPLRPLRLLYVGNTESVHLQRWSSFFAGRGHEVHAAGLGRASAPAGTAVPTHGLGRPELAFIALRALADRLRVDLIHAHYLTHYGWITYASLRRPYAVTLWGSDVLLDAGQSLVRRAWARLTLSRAALVTADSEPVLAVARRLGASATRTVEIQFGVDTERFTPGARPVALARRLGVDGARVILAPRSVAPLYRTTVALRALELLPEDTVLVVPLTGVDDVYRAELETTADRLGLRERLRLIPAMPHEEIDGLYRLASVVVSIPASDGTPVSVLEALATGVPVVATDVPSVRPLIEAVDQDWLVPVDDVAATARAIQKALQSSGAKRDALVRAGRELVRTRADRDTNMLHMERLYYDLITL